MRSWTGEVTAFGLVVRIEQVSREDARAARSAWKRPRERLRLEGDGLLN